MGLYTQFYGLVISSIINEITTEPLIFGLKQYKNSTEEKIQLNLICESVAGLVDLLYFQTGTTVPFIQFIARPLIRTLNALC